MFALHWTTRLLPDAVRFVIAQLVRRSITIGKQQHHNNNNNDNNNNNNCNNVSNNNNSSNRSVCCSLNPDQELHFVKAVQGVAKRQQAAEKSQRFGEDAWCIATTPSCDLLAVADGVGAWREVGIDAGIFARELMFWCNNYALRTHTEPCNPISLLIASYVEITEQKHPIRGGCTACIVALDRKRSLLHSANLGDSGFMVVRDGKLLYKSEEQLHSFNTPYQLTVPPDEERLLVHCDMPEEAQTASFEVCKGDVILLATDGLFDNVPIGVLLTLLADIEGETDPCTLQHVADSLVTMAHELSTSEGYLSPFARRARQHNLLYTRGGKPDDITVILATVASATKRMAGC